MENKIPRNVLFSFYLYDTNEKVKDIFLKNIKKKHFNNKIYAVIDIKMIDNNIQIKRKTFKIKYFRDYFHVLLKVFDSLNYQNYKEELHIFKEFKDMINFIKKERF